jgi:hypothetical protein
MPTRYWVDVGKNVLVPIFKHIHLQERRKEKNTYGATSEKKADNGGGSLPQD